MNKILFIFLAVFVNSTIYSQEQSYFNKGYVNYVTGDFEKAIEYFDLSIKENPGHGDSYYFKALLLATQGQFKEAETLFNKAIEIDPNEGAYFGDRGVLYANIGKMDKAIKDFKLAVKLDYSNPARHFNLAAYYLNQGDCVNAMKYLDDCLSVDEMHLSARFQRAVCNTIMDNEDKSIKDFTYLIENFENQSTVLNNRDFNQLLGGSFFLRGKIYGEKREYAQSVSDLKNALKYIDNDPELYNSLGYYMIYTDELDECIQHLDKSIQMSPSSLNYTSRSFAFFKMKNYEKAESDALEAKKLDENYPDTYYYLALIYKAKNKLKEACLMKNKAIELGSEQAKELELECN